MCFVNYVFGTKPEIILFCMFSIVESVLPRILINSIE